MSGPVFNLVLFALGGALAAAIFWPGHGVVAHSRRHRALASRVQLEDALKHLHNHEVRGQTCTLESVGGALEISSARVVGLVTRMQNAGLVRLADGRILLTEEGTRYALEVIRAHRLWERYLADETGVDPLEWHARAERQEHALTRDEADALERRLGNPRFDPHGDPIPTADGTVSDDASVSLARLAEGERGVVTHLEDEPPVVFSQLVASGIYLGMELRVAARSEQRIALEGDGRTVVLSPLLAENVSVQRLDDERAEDAGDVVTLASLLPGERARVTRVSPACRGIERRRLMDLGIVPGTQVIFERRGLTGGLSAYRVRGASIALRDEQARMITVAREAEEHAAGAGEGGSR